MSEFILNYDGLRDPLGVAKVVCGLHGSLESAGYQVALSEDLARFASVKETARKERVTPYFDASIVSLSPGRAFWMELVDGSGKVVGLQAFRLDQVESSLADWCATYTIGLYMRRQEILVPTHATPPRGSLSERLRGRLAYHGELWIDKHCKVGFPVFPRIGMLLAMVKWQPEAIWALTGQSMATRGHMVRMGYGHLEQSFLTWEWEPDGAEQAIGPDDEHDHQPGADQDRDDARPDGIGPKIRADRALLDDRQLGGQRAGPERDRKIASGLSGEAA